MINLEGKVYYSIEVPDENDSYSRMVLDNRLYHIRFTWNGTGEYWKFGLYGELGDPLVQGIKLVPNFPVNLFLPSDRLPYGVFGVITKQARIGRKDFVEGRAEFIYSSIADNLAALRR